MSDQTEPEPARGEPAQAGDTGAAAEVRSPGPGAPPSGRPGWATGVVGFPTLLGMLVVGFAATFGLAALGGWGGLAACALVIAAMISLVVAWAE